jgi:hypothetical protein
MSKVPLRQEQLFPHLQGQVLSLHVKIHSLLGYRGVCGEPAISLHSRTVPLVQWSTHLLPMEVLMLNRDSPVSIVSLHVLQFFCKPPTIPSTYD